MYNNFNLNDYKSIVLYLPNYLHYEYTNCVQNVLVPSLQNVAACIITPSIIVLSSLWFMNSPLYMLAFGCWNKLLHDKELYHK